MFSKKKEYSAVNGLVYESYEAYCNSQDLDLYEIMIKLHSGSRRPQNEFEQKMLEEMKDIEHDGGQIDFSENIW